MRFARYLRDPSLALRKVQWYRLYAGPRRDVTVDCYNGRLTFDSRDKLIGKYLYVDRAYERPYLETALRALERDGYLRRDGSGTLLDVGANIGMICVALLRHGWFDRAVAFEPAPPNLRLLEMNVAQNGFDGRILRLPYALSSRDGELELELSDYNSGDNRIRHSAAGGAWREDRREVVRVPVRTLDGALRDTGIEPREIRLAWVDIQGHEGQFFHGARQTLACGAPVVSEFWPYAILRSGMTREAYVRIVSEMFTHFYHLTDAGTEKLPIARLDALFPRYAAPKENTQVILVRDT
jgi:FkbM family methyltransferase